MNVARYFDRTASAFDALYEEDSDASGWFNHFFRKGVYERVHESVKALEVLQAPALLDVGCGSARNSVIFLRNGASRVVGIDFAEEMLKLAEERVRRHGLQEQCEFVNGDFLTFPGDQSFDASIALGVFDYIAEPVPFLKKMMSQSRARVIASFPGMALLRAPLRKLRYALKGCPVYFYSRRSIHDLCRAAELTDYRLLRLSSSSYLLVGAVGDPPLESSGKAES